MCLPPFLFLLLQFEYATTIFIKLTFSIPLPSKETIQKDLGITTLTLYKVRKKKKHVHQENERQQKRMIETTMVI